MTDGHDEGLHPVSAHLRARHGLDRPSVVARLTKIGLLMVTLLPAAAATSPTPIARTFMSGIASTPKAIEIRISFSPDNRRRLWGRIDPEGKHGFEIYESAMTKKGWSYAVPVSFNSEMNDFDPSFAPDGRSVLFFSNRPGGRGGDDIWSVPFDERTRRYGAPRNLGAPINTSKDEWAPSLQANGRELLFSTNGHGGQGKHDLFISRRDASGWSTPRNLGPGVNGPQDDFDAVVVRDNTLIFTSGDAEVGPLALYRAKRQVGGFVGRERLGPAINCSKTFNLGPSWNSRQPTLLYFSARCPESGTGGADILVAKLK